MVLEQFGYKICSALREIMGADYDIELREVTKNNGVLLHGVMITGKGSNVSPAVYIDELYEEISFMIFCVSISAMPERSIWIWNFSHGLSGPKAGYCISLSIGKATQIC